METTELKVMTNDGQEVYTTWSILEGITYFKQLMNSGMEETRTNEINFNLNLEQTNFYLNLISEFDVNLSEIKERWFTEDESTRYHFNFKVFDKVTKLKETLKTLSFDNLIAIYNQTEFHQNDRLLVPFNHFIENLSYSIELYNWNLQSNVFNTDFLASRCIDQMSRNEIDKKYNSNLRLWDKARPIVPIVLPPSSDESFWNEMSVQITELKVIDSEGKLTPSKPKPKLGREISWWKKSLLKDF